MKKIILVSMVIIALLLVVGCEELTEEEKEILGEEGAAIAGQAYNQAGVRECKRDNECWQSLLSCYRAECRNAGDRDTRDACIDNCLAEAQGEEEEECVPKTRDDCIRQEYAGGIYECGMIDDDCGGTVNCDMQSYAGGVACPNGKVCEENRCVEAEDECTPKTRDDCVHQEYAGGVYQCGEIDDGCGGTVNCDMQSYAGGVACPNGKTCSDNLCVDECVPKTRDDCIRQEYAGGIYECGIIDDGCGGTINCDMQSYAGGVACPNEKVCQENRCVEGGDAEEEEAQECPTTLKDYEVQAYAVQGVDNRGEFEINGDHFVLDVGGANHAIAGGGVVGIDDTLVQSYAGGLRGVEWDLVSACSSDYAFETYYDDTPNVDAKFTVVSVSTGLSPVSQEESFNLNIGETKVLRDGAKIILKNSLTQGYAGGLHGVVFELICS